jgi:hypothetical protein
VSYVETVSVDVRLTYEGPPPGGVSPAGDCIARDHPRVLLPVVVLYDF